MDPATRSPVRGQLSRHGPPLPPLLLSPIPPITTRAPTTTHASRSAREFLQALAEKPPKDRCSACSKYQDLPRGETHERDSANEPHHQRRDAPGHTGGAARAGASSARRRPCLPSSAPRTEKKLAVLAAGGAIADRRACNYNALGRGVRALRPAQASWVGHRPRTRQGGSRARDSWRAGGEFVPRGRLSDAWVPPQSPCPTELSRRLGVLLLRLIVPSPARRK